MVIMTKDNMNNRTKESDWTPSLVLEHLSDLINANDIKNTQSFAAARAAVEVAAIASEKSTAQAFASSEKAIRDALAAVEKSTAAAFIASEKAVALAEANAERWRQDAQEWRQRMTEREKDFSTKNEHNALKERLDRGEGKGQGISKMMGWLAAGLTLLVSIVGFVLSHIK
jgi:hypothetical protein